LNCGLTGAACKLPSASRLSLTRAMAPKRDKGEGGERTKTPKKAKAADEVPSFNPEWKVHKPSLLYLGEDLEPSDKLAVFDLDGTLVEWKSGVAFSLAPDSWEWFNAGVPRKLQVRGSCASKMHASCRWTSRM
jgi:Polynucleotide kinase 3 phosphatase